MQNKRIQKKTKKIQYKCNTIQHQAIRPSPTPALCGGTRRPLPRCSHLLSRQQVHFSNPNLSPSLCICIYHPVFACFLKPLQAYPFSLCNFCFAGSSVFQHSYFCVFFAHTKHTKYTHAHTHTKHTKHIAYTWRSHHTSVLRRDFALCCGIKYKWGSNSV